MSVDELLAAPLRVINIGLEAFAENLEAAGVTVVQVDWRPPAGGDARLAALLASLDDPGQEDRDQEDRDREGR